MSDPARVVADLQSEGEAVELRRLLETPPLRRPAGRDDRANLTAASARCCARAHEMGYFDHPRDANDGDVADALGISTSTFPSTSPRRSENSWMTCFSRSDSTRVMSVRLAHSIAITPPTRGATAAHRPGTGSPRSAGDSDSYVAPGDELVRGQRLGHRASARGRLHGSVDRRCRLPISVAPRYRWPGAGR